MTQVIHVMDRISSRIEKFISVLLFICISVLFLTVVFVVITRNINVPVVWLGELGTFSCIWAIYLGMALAYKKDMFPNVDILPAKITARIGSGLSIIYDILILFFLAAVLWSSRLFLSHLFSSGQISPELRVPMFYAYLGPVVGYICTVFFCLVSLAKKILMPAAAGADE